jgi:hypothetical protein
MLKTADVQALASEIFAQALGPERFDHLEIETKTDHDGEPSFYVQLYYKPGVDPRDVKDESRAQADLRRRLLDLDEERFPYLRPFFVGDEILTGGNEEDPSP